MRNFGPKGTPGDTPNTSGCTQDRPRMHLRYAKRLFACKHRNGLLQRQRFRLGNRIFVRDFASRSPSIGPSSPASSSSCRQSPAHSQPRPPLASRTASASSQQLASPGSCGPSATAESRRSAWPDEPRNTRQLLAPAGPLCRSSGCRRGSSARDQAGSECCPSDVPPFIGPEAMRMGHVKMWAQSPLTARS